MSSISSSIASQLSSAVNSSTSSPAAANYFSGMSNYAQDLNNAISRAVQIADLPVQLLQNNVNDLTNQQDELETLKTDVAGVQTALQSLASAVGNMLTAQVSDSSVATATVGSAATPGTYRLAVSNLGSYSDALSIDGLAKVTDTTSQNISASSSYTLTVTNGNGNSMRTPISFSGGNLNVLAQAIDESGAGVQATVVNVGSSASPDYRLSLESSTLGPVTMQLNDGSKDLLVASGPPGTLAQYAIDGKQISSDTDTVTLAPGLTAVLTGETDGATITVADDPSTLSNSLESLVSAYNTAVNELANNRGQTDVALAGQSIVYQVSNALESVAAYAGGTGQLSSLAALGIKFSSTTGQLSFDQSTFAAASGQSTALSEFLGSAGGSGFLGMATAALNSLLDPNSGLLTGQLDSVQSGITATNDQITAKEAAVTQLQSSLTQQMAAADSMIYSLQQQATTIQEMFTAEQDNEIQLGML